MTAAAAMVSIALAAGCNPRPTMAVGGITASLGLVVTQIPDDCDDKFICFENADIGAFIAITGLIILGIGIVGYGLQESEPKPPVIQPGHVLSNGVLVPPAPFPIGRDPTAEEQPVVTVETDLPPLPAAELDYSDATQRQFAYQASSAARRGDCQAAVASGQRLAVDLEQRLLVVDAAYAKCVSGH